jgi:hypothetical protein
MSEATEAIKRIKKEHPEAYEKAVKPPVPAVQSTPAQYYDGPEGMRRMIR